MRRVDKTDYGHYTCGQCNVLIEYQLRYGIPESCPDCGYAHKGRNKLDVPPEIKVNLSDLKGKYSY